jgi:hypothetical protein
MVCNNEAILFRIEPEFIKDDALKARFVNVLFKHGLSRKPSRYVMACSHCWKVFNGQEEKYERHFTNPGAFNYMIWTEVR